MVKPKLKPSSPSSSIHLVPRQEHQEFFPEDGRAGESRPLSLGMRQHAIVNASDSLPGEHLSRESHEHQPATSLNPATVLLELFELLEDYSPVWYTEENHHRAVAALRQTIQ
jgi:hypothetical protein